MQKDHRLAESGEKMLLELGGEGDFRDQDQDIPAPGQGLFGRPQIDLGLAAAGDAVQQKGGILACRQGRDDLRQHLLLLVGQALRPLLQADRLAEGIAKDPALQLADQPLRQQGGDGLAGAGYTIGTDLWPEYRSPWLCSARRTRTASVFCSLTLERKAGLPAPCLDPSLSLPGIRAGPPRGPGGPGKD